MVASRSIADPLLLVRDYRSALGVGGGSLDSLAASLDAAGQGRFLGARLPVESLALGSVAAVGDALDRYFSARGHPPRPWRLDAERVAASFASDRLFRLNGEPIDGFAALSGFFRCADGWVRTHANYPHHRDRLCTALGLPADVTRAEFAARIAGLKAARIEDAAAEHGAIAARVRSEQEWSDSEEGRVASAAPLLVRSPAVPGERRLRARLTNQAGPFDPDRPLAGVRVLDLTRVIAGPVGTRTLALLGADVLRVDSPRLPEIPWQHTDSGQGKRSTSLDLATAEGLATADRLLEHADVLVSGYRPGAIEALGLRMPAGLAHIEVDAWGVSGPWGGRRGFDSIVQAASGIALVEAAPAESAGAMVPGALPAQALDHASGYLLAAAAIDALTERLMSGHGSRVSLSLSRTAGWLLRAPGRSDEAGATAVPGSDSLVTHDGVTTARPALADFDDYPWPAHALGSDAAEWATFD